MNSNTETNQDIQSSDPAQTESENKNLSPRLKKIKKALLAKSA